MNRLMDKSTVRGMALLLVIGLAVGLVGNLAAGPSRRLEWNKDYPPKGKPNCPETLPVAGAEPAAATAAFAVEMTEPDTAPMAATGEAVQPTDPGAPTASAPDVAPAAGATGSAASAPAPAPVAPSAPVPVAAASADVPPVPPGKPWVELSPAQVDAVDARGALFIDARMTTQYQEGHIKGAIAIPIWESGVEEKVAQVAFEVEGDLARPLVVYCNGGDCEDSHNLGQKLWEAGHTAVYVYKDGYPDWVKRGRAVTAGDAR